MNGVLQFFAIVAVTRAVLVVGGLASIAAMVITGHPWWTIPGIIVGMFASTPIRLPEDITGPPSKDKPNV